MQFSSIFKIIVLCQLSFVYGMDTSITLNKQQSPSPEELLADPVSILINNRNLLDEFKTEIASYHNKTVGRLLPRYQESIKTFEKKSPLFCLHECMARDCLLTRPTQGFYRNRFETIIADVLSDKTGGDNKPIKYTSCGSGYLFTDLMVLTRFLQKQPKACITFDAIDPIYRSCVVARAKKEFYQVGQEESAKHLHEGIVREVEAEMKGDDRTPLVNYLTIDTGSKQLLHQLQQSFPEATITMCLYASTLAYIEGIKKGTIAIPNVIGAADLESPLINKTANLEHQQLCYESMKIKSDVANIALTVCSKDQKVYTPSIIHFKLSQKEGMDLYQYPIVLAKDNAS